MRHAAIRHDTPVSRDGIVAVWREIISILRKQEADPTYQHVMPLPATSPAVR